MALINVFLVVLLNVFVSTVGMSPNWEDWEIWSEYVPYPDEAQGSLEMEYNSLKHSPDVLIIQSLPEEEHIWPLVKGITIRNHFQNKILWAHASYLIADGKNIGCREEIYNNDTGQSAIFPVTTTSCENLCLNKGRYCAPHLPPSLQRLTTHQGKDLVLEALRRMCFDSYYHATDIKWFQYLEEFDRMDCFRSYDLTNCSMTVFDKISHADYPNLANCMQEDLLDTDSPNDTLEKQLELQRKTDYTKDTQMPVLEFGGVVYNGQFTVKDMFRDYCEQFPEDGIRPMSCDFCEGCEDVRLCLWKLECDSVSFDVSKDLGASYAETSSQKTEREGETAGSDLTKGNSGMLILGILIGLIFGAISSSFFIYRDYRSRQTMAQMSASQLVSGYRDNDDSDDQFEEGLELSSGNRSDRSAPPGNAFKIPEVI